MTVEPLFLPSAAATHPCKRPTCCGGWAPQVLWQDMAALASTWKFKRPPVMQGATHASSLSDAGCWHAPLCPPGNPLCPPFVSSRQPIVSSRQPIVSSRQPFAGPCCLCESRSVPCTHKRASCWQGSKQDSDKRLAWKGACILPELPARVLMDAFG